MIIKKIASSFKMKKRSTKILICVLVISILFGSYTFYDNFRLDVTVYSISSEKLSSDFDGYKIAHISDYHNRSSETINNSIFESLKEQSPNIIVFTGDAVDSKHPDFEQSVSFMKEIQEIAQVYFVTGNHEHRLSKSHTDEFNKFINDIEHIGVIILDGESVRIETSSGEYINLHGIYDPYFTECKPWLLSDATDDLCDEISVDDGYNILLAHHPEQMDVYAKYGFDLVLSGHAHGGQITLFGFPFKVPDQSGLPKYSSGVYEQGETEMIVSRGIGYSVVPLRLFCPSQLVYIEFNI